MKSFKVLSVFLGVVGIGVFLGTAFGSEEVGSDAGSIANMPAPDPSVEANADMIERIALAQCICKIIESGSGETATSCLPEAHKKEAQRLKKTGCFRIASPAEYKAVYKAALKEKKKKSDAAATKEACDSASKPGAHTMGEGRDRTAIFLSPSLDPSGNSVWSYKWGKKVIVHDEVNDIIQFRSPDPGVRPPAGVGAGGEAINLAILKYVDMNSYAADIGYLDARKPANAASDQYWGPYRETSLNLRQSYMDLCELLKKVPAGAHKVIFTRCKEKALVVFVRSQTNYANRNN